MVPIRIKELFAALEKQPLVPFPATRVKLEAPPSHGVYVIRSRGKRVLHVGRTLYGKSGLRQRLRNHITGQSSFVRTTLHGDATKLRQGCTYQFFRVPNARDRLLLEYYATVCLCPKHLGVGKTARG